jgi:enoyl-CoA hydratase/carnithine racemase
MDIDFLGACFADPTHTFSNFVTRYHELLHRIEEANIPIIAAVNGIARAGGIELLLACDLVVMSSEAKIGDHHLASGIPPGAGAGVRLQRILGPIRAREFIFSARWMSADEAFQSGVASHVCTHDQIEIMIDEIVDNLSRTSRTALAATKSALLQACPTRPGCQAELKVFLDFVTNDPDASEGYRAWVEKRSPQWK